MTGERDDGGRGLYVWIVPNAWNSVGVRGRCCARGRETLLAAMRSSPRNDKWTLLNRELSYRAAINIAPDKVTNLKEIQYKSYGNSIGDLIRAELSLAAETPLITGSSLPSTLLLPSPPPPCPRTPFLRSLHLSHISRYYETWKFKWTEDNGAARCPKMMPDTLFLFVLLYSPFVRRSRLGFLQRAQVVRIARTKSA